jgi:hypothetical protein
MEAKLEQLKGLIDAVNALHPKRPASVGLEFNTTSNEWGCGYYTYQRGYRVWLYLSFGPNPQCAVDAALSLITRVLNR